MLFSRGIHAAGIDEAIALAQAHPFALLLSTRDERVLTTHIPVMIEADGSLVGHLHGANPQAEHFDGGLAEVVFRGPHAHVAAAWYQTTPAVPTWNYAVAHAQGRIHRVDDPAEKRAHVLEMVRRFDPPESLEVATEDYLERLLPVLHMFRMTEVSWEGQFKLSQNKSVELRGRVIDRLEASADAEARAVAALMRAREPSER